MEDFVGSNGFQGERKRDSSSPTKDKQTKDKLYRDKKKFCPPNRGSINFRIKKLCFHLIKIDSRLKEKNIK